MIRDFLFLAMSFTILYFIYKYEKTRHIQEEAKKLDEYIKKKNKSNKN